MKASLQYSRWMRHTFNAELAELAEKSLAERFLRVRRRTYVISLLAGYLPIIESKSRARSPNCSSSKTFSAYSRAAGFCSRL